MQKKRFNDTIALKLPPCPPSSSIFADGESSRFQRYLQTSEKKRQFSISDEPGFAPMDEHLEITVSVFKDDCNPSSPLLPSPRTYHASCLVSQFMVVVGGESNSSDLGDLWVLDLESRVWRQPEVDGKNTFSAKRFHTASTLQRTKVVTFGGCHSEYVHLNDLNVFDFKDFLRDPI